MGRASDATGTRRPAKHFLREPALRSDPVLVSTATSRHPNVGNKLRPLGPRRMEPGFCEELLQAVVRHDDTQTTIRMAWD